MPTHVKMSPDALARCRSMKITRLEDGIRSKLEVFDPKFGNRAIAVQVVRTEHDLARFKLAWTRTFQVPPENLTEVSETQPQDTETQDANDADEKTPDVHEHREEVLDSDEGGSKPTAKEIPKLVPHKARQDD